MTAADRPFWLGHARPASATELPAQADVVVLGAGIAGLVTSLLLARGGVDVVVLDRRGPGEGATGRSAGFLIAGTADHPSVVARTIGADRARELWRYTVASLDFLVSCLDEEGIAAGVQREGGLVLAMDDEELGELEASRALVDTGELWTEREVERRTGFVGFAGGWFRPRDGLLHPGRLCEGLAATAARRGARIVSGIAAQSVSGRRVVTNRGAVTAGHVVLAVNAALPRVDGRFAACVEPVRAQMHARAPAREPRSLPWPVYAHHGYEYWRQEPTGELLFGGCRWAAREAERGITDDAALSDAVAAAQDELVARHLPAFAKQPVTRRWTGIMAFTPDALPIVGAMPDDDRLLVCGGWNGHGLALAPLSARLVADRILGHTDGPEIPLGFTPGRFFTRGGP